MSTPIPQELQLFHDALRAQGLTVEKVCEGATPGDFYGYVFDPSSRYISTSSSPARHDNTLTDVVVLLIDRANGIGRAWQVYTGERTYCEDESPVSVEASVRHVVAFLSTGKVSAFDPSDFPHVEKIALPFEEGNEA